MSALDERIRHLAREVATGLADGLPGSSDRMAALEKQVTELAARVEELEKAAAPAPAAKRATRKTAEPGE